MMPGKQKRPLAVDPLAGVRDNIFSAKLTSRLYLRMDGAANVRSTTTHPPCGHAHRRLVTSSHCFYSNQTIRRPDFVSSMFLGSPVTCRNRMRKTGFKLPHRYFHSPRIRTRWSRAFTSFGNAKFIGNTMLPCEASLRPARFYAVRQGLEGYTDAPANCPIIVQKSWFGRPIFRGRTCPYPFTKQCYGLPITPYKPVTYKVKPHSTRNLCGYAPPHPPN